MRSVIRLGTWAQPSASSPQTGPLPREALCRQGFSGSRAWLLRHACDGDFLNGYFAGKLATAAHLHEAITSTDADADLVDHTGRLLTIMAGCGGMGMTLEHYPPAPIVLAAHAGHLARQTPTASRYFTWFAGKRSSTAGSPRIRWQSRRR